MKLNKFLKDSERVASVEDPEIIILVGPPGSGKTYISENYKETHVIIDVDELRDPPEDLDNVDESYYRYKSQSLAEKRRDEILERLIINRKNIVMHVLTGSRYWYEQAINIKYSGYKVNFMFIRTNKKTVKENIIKKNKREREIQGYAIVAENDFIDYSFTNIPQLLLLTLKDNLDVINDVSVANQEGTIYKDISKEDIYRGIKSEYAKEE